MMVFFIEYSIDRGGTWIKLDNNPDPTTWYNETGHDNSRLFGGESLFSGNTGGAYVVKNTDLSFLAENPSVAFRFVFLSDESINQAGLAIDDFKVEGPTTAQFSADNEEICEGESVIFTNESSGAITEYAWNFGADADPITAQGEGPHTVLYAVAGNKSVSLTINGTVTEDKTDLITVNPLPAIVTYTIAEPAICLGENAEIEFSNLEDGVNYSILDAVTLDEILSFQSDGSSNLLVTIENIEVDVTIVVQAVNTTTNCMLMMTDELSITTKPSPLVTLVFNEGTLESSAGDSYEWMLDGVVIDGATDQTLVPSLKGIYTVIVSVNGCIGTSNEVDVTVVGINDMALSSTIKIYPNPTAQYLTIESAQTLDGTFELAVYAMDGKVILRKEVKLDEYESLRLDIHDLKRGVYILKLYNINAHFEQVIFKTDN